MRHARRLLLLFFLLPSGTALAQGLDLPAGDAVAEIAVDGPLALDGPARLTAALQPGARATAFASLRATGAGWGAVRLHVTGLAGFDITRETAILVRPARGVVTDVMAGALEPGADASLAVAADRFIPGIWRASASFGGAVRYSVAGLTKALADYPLNFDGPTRFGAALRSAASRPSADGRLALAAARVAASG